MPAGQEARLDRPRFLKCPQAAAYLGVSATTFALEVRAGIWPPAMRRGDKQSALTWDRRLLDRAADRLAALLVPSPTGKPWLYRNFSRAWDACKTKAGISGVQRRDLRRTAMVRMAEAGATTAQIAAVSGHTIDQTSRILDTYIPRRGEVAAGAIDAWERGGQKQAVVGKG